MAGNGGNTIGGCSTPVACPVITINPPTIPAGTVGAAYSQTLTATGGVAPYTFSVVSGTLAPGLTLTPGGVLAGTPTSAGTAPVTIRAADANGCPAFVTYTITILTGVPTLPQMFALLLALALAAIGYVQLRGARPDRACPL
jgi:hypothetical protein